MPCVMPLGHDIYINKFAPFSLKLFEIQRLMEEAGWKKRAEFRGERDIRWEKFTCSCLLLRMRTLNISENRIHDTERSIQTIH